MAKPAVSRRAPAASRKPKTGSVLESVNPLARGLEKRRKAKGWTVFQLCFVARTPLSVYKNILSGKTNPHPSTLDRLDVALDQPEVPSPSVPVVWIRILHRSAMIELACAYRLSADKVLAADFSKQRPRDRVWLWASKIRRRALYIVKVEFPDVDAETLALAAGCTKQNVGQALAQVEDEREADPRLDKILERVRARLTGRA